MKQIRKFESGAIRDNDDGKFNYYGFMHPLTDYSFAKYMHKHRKMADGSMRDANNWWSGFGQDIVMQSLCRHIEDLKLINAGFFVYEKREDGKVERVVLKQKLEPLPENMILITYEDACNGIRFNSEAYKLEGLLKDE